MMMMMMMMTDILLFLLLLNKRTSFGIMDVYDINSVPKIYC